MFVGELGQKRLHQQTDKILLYSQVMNDNSFNMTTRKYV